ncbi:hypothetical protein CIP107561_02284 [Corynebacterium diphtheriae]|nr:hypothetical protein CIP107561_02284 [Corynebacterium diphtheriae]
MAQDIGVLGFVGIRVSKPSVQTKDLLCRPTEMEGVRCFVCEALIQKEFH